MDDHVVKRRGGLLELLKGARVERIGDDGSVLVRLRDGRCVPVTVPIESVAALRRRWFAS